MAMGFWYRSNMIPIGGLYHTTVSDNPSVSLGYGTWEAFGSGRCLVGVDTEQTEFDTVEETGGSKTSVSTGTVSQPTFTGNAVTAASSAATPDLFTPDVLGTGGAPITTATGTVSQPTYTGSVQSVLQPYITVYIWKRTA